MHSKSDKTRRDSILSDWISPNKKILPRLQMFYPRLIPQLPQSVSYKSPLVQPPPPHSSAHIFWTRCADRCRIPPSSSTLMQFSLTSWTKGSLICWNTQCRSYIQSKQSVHLTKMFALSALVFMRALAVDTHSRGICSVTLQGGTGRWGVRLSCVGPSWAHATGESEESQLCTHTRMLAYTWAHSIREAVGSKLYLSTAKVYIQCCCESRGGAEK